MYTLKSIARRGTMLGVAAAFLAATIVPAAQVFADALNPLTNRSLTLSSSSPGWSNTDGSGNTKYAPPNSGANGKQTGNTFEFNVSTDSSAVGADPVKTMTFQYCTTSAGLCRAPGDNTTAGTDTTTTSDLKVVTSSPAEVGSGNFSTVVDTATTGLAGGRVKAVPGFTNPDNPSDTTGVYAAKNVTGNFVVYYLDSTDSTWKQSSGWSMYAVNRENATATLSGLPTVTGQNNYIILKKATGETFKPTNKVRVVFFGTTANYIQNPGSGAFFVKINTYNKEYVPSGPSTGQVALSGLAPTGLDEDIIDGGVTVANVMNQSIQITTKVLETMQFSVGTVDPNTLNSARVGETDSSGADATAVSELDAAHGNTNLVNPKIRHQVCDTILKAMTPNDPANVLRLGNQSAESSLETDHTYSTHSYWRLSSNSSAGATVYYSGHTLSNTVGDQIDPIGKNKQGPSRGAEQFGLALANTGHQASDITANGVTPEYAADTSGSNQNYSVNYAQEATYENGNDNGKTSIHTASLTADGVIGNPSWHAPRLYPLLADANYNNGTGAIDGTPTTEFAFDDTSDTIPVALATESDQVVDCVTGKMRYIANIAATTPAGIYTTKINYIAAPQY